MLGLKGALEGKGSWQSRWQGHRLCLEVRSFSGAQIEGIRYEQLMPYVQPEGDAFRVIVGDFVTTEDGAGIVHIAPTFGADDFRVAKQNNIPALLVTMPDGSKGPLVDQVKADLFPKWGNTQANTSKITTTPTKAPRITSSTDVQIAIKLKEENKAFKVEKYEHDYPHCWRTDKPVLYYPLDAWFIKTTAVKDRMVELNNTINWKPESTGSGRFGNWLENLVDWNLSRSRFWGIPLPIWADRGLRREKMHRFARRTGRRNAKGRGGGLHDPRPSRPNSPCATTCTALMWIMLCW
jgi:isoleucyl-tRNA synthetase